MSQHRLAISGIGRLAVTFRSLRTRAQEVPESAWLQALLPWRPSSLALTALTATLKLPAIKEALRTRRAPGSRWQ